jgi:hypothetical protein
MVFIHGGGYHVGSASTFMFGPEYLLERDVILVTLNYRGGIHQFLSIFLNLRILVLLPVSTLPYGVKDNNYS